ncbi:cytochrome P450 4C1 isoform X2 [Halyomorpha halys]|uniref:cytochrome P450 4C1 isoform X2 n=1 Tax=Halyomorpha halys TaxID=286706 RepID=UPI0006D4DED1|nr:cytochrome P450 4C1-like isoform X2 [Halyomorpha halys]
MMSMTLSLLCAFLSVLIVGFLVKSWRRSKLPGPSGIPFLGQALTMWLKNTRDIVPLFVGWREKYGGLFEVEVFGMIYVFISEPELVEPILTSSTNITKGYFEYSFFRPMFNDGLIVSDGDKWRSRRKLLTPSFHFKILESSLKGMCRNSAAYVSTLLASGGKPIKLEDIVYLNTLKIIVETAMGVELSSEDKEQNEYLTASKQCVDGVVERYLRVWQYSELTFRLCDAGKQFFKNVDITHNFDQKVIRERKELFQAAKNGTSNNGIEKNGRRKAFLDTLLELDNSNPGLFTEADIMEEVDTFMTAGHHTTASAMMFAHFVLANNPAVQEKVYDEQLEIFEGSERMPTIQDLNKMIYLEMVIKETLRLYPSVPFHTRLLTEDLRIDESTVIKAGQSILVFTYCVHRSKKHWENPEEFIPERFAPGIERHPFSFIPFSAGPRNCIGQKFAIMELKTVLSTVVRKCRLEPVTTSVDLDYGITIKPSSLMVKAFPRDKTKASLS